MNDEMKKDGHFENDKENESWFDPLQKQTTIRIIGGGGHKTIINNNNNSNDNNNNDFQKITYFRKE